MSLFTNTCHSFVFVVAIVVGGSAVVFVLVVACIAYSQSANLVFRNFAAFCLSV